MSTFETGSPRTLFQVKSGSNVARLNGLKSGTLYAVLLRGAYGSRTTNVIQPGTSGAGMGQVPFASLPAAVQAQITSLQSEMGVNYPNGYFVAGASANTVRDTPTWSVDKDSSKDTFSVVRVAVPSFSSPVPSYLAGIRMRISTDGGDTYGRFEDVRAPFANDANYATFTVPVPYEKKVLVKFQAIYKDGTFGRECRPVEFTGVATPANPPAAAPVVHNITGAYNYSSKNNKLQLSLTVQVTPDPAAGSAVVQAVDATGKVKATSEVLNTVPGTALNLVLDDVDPSVATYTINAYSNILGKLSAPTTNTYNTSAATSYTPAKLDTTKIFLSEEIYRMGDGTLESRIRVKFEGALDAERTRGSIYIRNRNTTAAPDLTTFNGFTKVGMATGNFLTDGVAAGGTQQWDVVVLAVGKDGSEAAFSSDQIKTVSIVQYANYQPPQQAVPTVTVAGENSVIIAGTYVRAAGTPEPVKIRAYKSETVGAIGDKIGTTPELLADADFTYLGSGNYAYTLTISDVSAFSVGSNNYDITLRAVLENGNMHATSTKTTVRVTRALPAAPGVTSVTPYVKTVKGVITGFSALSAGSQSGYTPAAGGNGTTLTITPPKSAVVVEVSDPGGTPGLNPELVTNASVDPSTGIVTFTPATNSGSRNIRFAWKTSFGNSAWSAATQITFPVDNVVDSTVPDLSPCAPRFTQNSDGSITITWSAATFGPSGLGSYVIRRNSTNSAGTSVVVGTVTTNTNLTFTDFIDFARIGQTFYYFLEATSAQAVKSASPIAVKLASANSYAVETTVAAVSTDSAPAVPTGLSVKGAQGGFDITWANNTERDLKEYVLEFSAAGTFADTVTTVIKGTSYFQTAGATAAKATADAYRWRLKARDFGGNTSAATANASPDNTNYGSVTDNAPNNPAGVTIVNNADGSITLTITQASTNVGTYYRVVRKSWSSIAGWVEGTGGTVENDIQIPAGAASSTTTYRDAGLKAGLYYNYRVYSRSKLGTESAGFVYATAPLAATDTTAPTAPTIAVTPNRGVSSVVVTPAEANGTIELFCNIGTTTWNAATATKVASAPVGTTANAVAFSISEDDAANPVGRAWGARHIDAWGNVSGWSNAVSGTALNFLRADLIDARYIKAGEIGLDLLKVGTVQKQSLVGNGHFGTYNTYGDSMSGWTLGSGTGFNPSTGQYLPGGSTTPLNVVRFDRANAGVLAEQTITVLPGMTYTVVGLAYPVASVSAPHPVASLRVMAMDGTTRISSATSNPSAGAIVPDFYKGQGITGAQANNSDSTSLGGGWNLIAYKFTVPANMTQVRLQLAIESFSGSGNACVYTSFIQAYSDSLVEASASADQVNQLKAIAYGGDVSGSYDALTVRSIQNRLVATTAPTDKQTLAWDAGTSKYSPMSVATMLGYTPANKAGDTFSGETTFPSLVLNTAGGQNQIYFKNAGVLVSQITSNFGDNNLYIYHKGNNAIVINASGNITTSGQMTSTQFNGSGAGLTGTAASLTVNWSNVAGRPTQLSSFTNDSGYLTSSGTIANATNAAQLGSVVASEHMANRGSVAEASIDSAILNGFYTVGRASDSCALLTFNPGGSSGPTQLYTDYTGTFKFRNKTDSSTWTPWKYIVHSGNISTQSVSYANNAGTLGSLGLQSSGTAPGANQVIRSDSNGYIFAGWINTVSGDNGTTAINRVYASSDSYLRYYTMANFTDQVRQNASGTWNVSVTGTSSVAYRTLSDTAPAVVMNSDGAYYGHVARSGTQQWGLGWGGGVGASTMGYALKWNTNGSLYITQDLYCANTAYGIFGNSARFDTVDSGAAGDQLELCYTNGTGVVIGQNSGSIGTKWLKSSAVYTGTLFLTDTNTNLGQGSGYALRINTPTGYVDVGSMNSGYVHFQTDRPAFYFNKGIQVDGDLYRYGTNIAMTSVGFQTTAGSGFGYRFWNGADGYSITMNDYNAAMGTGGFTTGGADYNMSFRMDGVDAKRGGSDAVGRGFLFRNHSTGTPPFAQLAPFGNYTYWGGVLMMRDVGNNAMYGIYFYNGTLYMKQMA